MQGLSRNDLNNKQVRAFIASASLLLLSSCGGSISSGVSSAGATCAMAPSGLTSWWDGDLVSGLLASDLKTSSANNATLGSSVSTSNGKVSKAFDLDGTANGTLSVSDANSLDFTSAFSVSAWVKSTYNGRSLKDQTVVSKWGYSSLTDASKWSGLNTSALGATSIGFSGTVFDGRYMYFIPRQNLTGMHGNLVRFDTQGTFSNSSSWETVNLASAGMFNSTLYQGYIGGVFDGRYVYLVPNQNPTTFHGNFVRYDTQGAFTSFSSWTSVNIPSVLSGRVTPSGEEANYVGFHGAVFDGRYIYLVPDNCTGVGTCAANSSFMARYDTQSALSSGSSWEGVNIASASFLNSTNYRGFIGGSFDGRYVYYAPASNAGAWHGYAVRYDTQGSFSAAASWQGLSTQTNAIVASGAKGFLGSVFDGRYVYYVTYDNGTAADAGKITRFDTQNGDFLSSGWESVDVQLFAGFSGYRTFAGGAFDGRYVYFVPRGNPTSSTLIRYDTLGTFSSSSAWEKVDFSDATILNNTIYRGYVGAGFDGRYLYFAPRNNGALHGNVVRFDTGHSNASYMLKYGMIGGDGLGVSQPGPSVLLNTTNGALSASSHASLSAADYHHLAATYDGATLSLYVDGALAASRTGSGSIVGSSSNLSIGRITNGASFLAGQADEIQVFNSALSASSVTSIFSAGSGGLCK